MSEEFRLSDFVVVEFPEENENGNIPLAVISSTWLIKDDYDGECFSMWPQYIKTESSRVKAITNHTPLDPERCGKCKVNIKYRTGDYKKAIIKLKRLEELSSVSQSDDEEEESNRKRQKRRNTILENYYCNTSDEDLVPAAPKLVCDISGPTSSSTVVQNTQISNITSDMNTNNLNTSRRSTNVHTTPINKFLQTPTRSVSTSHGCINCKANSVAIQQILTKLQSMSGDINYLVSLGQQNASSDLLTTSTNMEQFGLPAKLVQQLVNLNNNLDDGTTMTDLVCSLQVVGGKDVTDTTRRVLSRIMTNSLALSYNWSGRNNKESFENLKNVVKLLTAAVRKNPFSRNATQQEVEAVIKVWLRSASDRDGGRNRRKTTQQI